MQSPWIFLKGKGWGAEARTVPRSWGGYGEGPGPDTWLGGFASEAHSRVIFDSSFTSCCFLKIPNHEIPAPTMFFYGTRASGWPQQRCDVTFRFL